ncbi:hemolysin family protein [Octadecabacter sp. CECT 8868]|uniref:hemolysin family protein n=1 Tax=Octadecabacter algicola TaxID=2909342 RepID=UPI001F2CBD02|nr:hemolysin family protein [Octadecabacter algicola]MCF2905135.1 hemolysin family protein [Octadecabacter algicola]
MGDTTDGPSSAAQSALSDIQVSKSKRGFFSRIVEALSPSDTPEDITPVTGYAPPLEARGMMNLRSMRVEDVMIPKADIVAVPVTINRDDLVQVFRDSGLTRLPVFDGTLDTPIGFVNLKDFALTHGFNGRSKTFNLRDLARTLLFVPPSMPLGVLLQKMQAERIHMALVIDEYGGSDGLVTIEDLIEQVVGEIEDEHDADEDTLWVAEKPGVFMVEAKAPLDEFESEIGMPLTEHDEIDEEEIETLGGLVFMLAGHVPARGEVIVHPDGPEFEVVEADPRRIKRLRVRLTGTSGG